MLLGGVYDYDVPYDARWPEEFLALTRPLRAALGELALRIDHIGSNSVPGLAAKDIIDIQVTVRDFTCTPELVEKLGSLGYTLAPEITQDHLPPLYQGPEADWEKRYFRPPASLRPMHLHIRALGLPNQRYPLLFRDYLRAHPMASAAYAQIKMALSRRQPDDVEFYYDIKDPLCDIVIEAAEEWAQATNWQI
ncbi:GrpB family protein [Ktedonobacter robiniae]|uniref:GrpB family protein n=1 Tax=Ktedonobacter robiniae TaxID=2778365 RepID=UPI001F46B446|nr:GrpB family protein [Ktedonobacter robiniae]